MPKFIPYDPNQSKMVIINYSDQLQPDTFEFAINHIIDHQLDLTIFHPRYQNDAGGRPAYDPAMGENWRNGGSLPPGNLVVGRRNRTQRVL